MGSKTDGVALPSGTTAERPASPQNGYVRYNTTIKSLESYVDGSWRSMAAGLTPSAGQDGQSLRWNNTAGQFEWFTAGAAGAGIGTLNGSTENSQSFGVSTTGSDFTISTSGGVHTFNLPTASGSARGLLSSSDWTSFNNKLGSTLTSGQMFVGNGSNVATAVSMSGDATLSNTGVLTLDTVGIGKGGTGATTAQGAMNALSPLSTKGDLMVRDTTNTTRQGVGSNNHFLVANSATSTGLEWRGLASGDLPTFTANRVMTTSAGGALQASSCGLNQVLSFDAGGSMLCTNVGPLFPTAFVNGGNSFAGAASLGTNDNYGLSIKTNNTTRMTVTADGHVGIGTTSPSDKLEIIFADSIGDSGGFTLSNPTTSINSWSGVTLKNDLGIMGYLWTGSSTYTELLAQNRTVLESDFVNSDGISIKAGKPTADINFYTGGGYHRMSISATGNVGIGTTTPSSKLDVAGQSRSVNSSGAAQVNDSSSINWNNGNAQSMSVACTTTTFTNMLDGGTYVLAVSETGTTTCTFSQSGLTFYFSPANGARTSGQRTVYTFQRIGNDVYVSWIKGFQ